MGVKRNISYLTNCKDGGSKSELFPGIVEMNLNFNSQYRKHEYFLKFHVFNVVKPKNFIDIQFQTWRTRKQLFLRISKKYLHFNDRH